MTRKRIERRHVIIVIVGGIFVAVLILYLGSCALILSKSLAPNPPPCATPRPSLPDVAVEPLRLQSAADDTPLAGWLLSSSGTSSGKRAIVLVHGLDSRAWNGDQPDVARAYLEAGFSVLVFDLRGHGRSGGDRLGLGWRERWDVRAAIDLLLERGFEPRRIGIHGTSYGAATALLAAAAIPEIAAVVADSAFYDVRDLMAREIQKRTHLPAGLVQLLRPGLALIARHGHGLEFDAIAPARAVTEIAPRPILFIHGSDDQVVPFEHARRLKAASGNRENELWELTGRGHTEGVRLMAEPCEPQEVSPMRDAYLAKVTSFFDEALR